MMSYYPLGMMFASKGRGDGEQPPIVQYSSISVGFFWKCDSFFLNMPLFFSYGNKEEMSGIL